MDGNSRWAEKRGHDAVWGHKKGAECVRGIVKYCAKHNLKYLSLFAFSCENWQRPKKEVEALFELLVDFLMDELGTMKENNIKLLSMGRRKNFTQKVNKALDYAIDQTAENTGLNLILCLDYSGRQEIVDAANKLKGKRVDEDEFRNFLYLPELPDIDLLIRTSGEERVSNFMLWQIAYSELYFTDVLWPDFTPDELEKAVADFCRRRRRFGKR